MEDDLEEARDEKASAYHTHMLINQTIVTDKTAMLHTQWTDLIADFFELSQISKREVSMAIRLQRKYRELKLLRIRRKFLRYRIFL